MKQFAKKLLFSAAPRVGTAVMSARARAHSHRVVAAWGGGGVARKLIGRFGAAVQEGPFAGLLLTPMTFAEQIGPYLLGVYESELDEAWHVILQGTYTRIVDVGAKFGYYSVGLARRYPGATVIAFDTDWWARRALRQMARANGTPNIQVRGHCSPERLIIAARPPAFIISDCEGHEAALFNESTAGAFRSATLLIETHDNLAPGVSASIRAAFVGTHEVRAYEASRLRRTSTRDLHFLSDAERALALHEVRGEQQWLLCLPATGPNEGLRAGPANP